MSMWLQAAIYLSETAMRDSERLAKWKEREARELQEMMGIRAESVEIPNKTEYVDVGAVSVEIRKNDEMLGAVTPCYPLDYYLHRNSGSNIKDRDLLFSPITPLTDLTTPNTWEAWFARRHNCEMGDAFEPQTEDILEMVGFDLQPAELIPDDQVLAAADHLRSVGDRQSTIAMMNRSNIDQFVWSVDPITKRWVCHAEFE